MFLRKEGWTLVHVRGSHHVLKKGDLKTSVPVHENKELRIGTLFGILEDIKMSRKDFMKLF
ncbi:MAG: type II toxin-antitoxin system HicA family toxin [bacterium]|nr:type II toxin-antitoxin system HicA family toxin [bacterium]